MTDKKKENTTNLKDLVFNNNNNIVSNKINQNKTILKEKYKFEEQSDFEENINIKGLSPKNLINQINSIVFEDSEDIKQLEGNINKFIKIENNLFL